MDSIVRTFSDDAPWNDYFVKIFVNNHFAIDKPVYDPAIIFNQVSRSPWN